MILIVCKDDEKALEKIAKDSVKANPNVFGKVFFAYKDPLQNLGINENLYIIAHGAFKDASGNPVIGDKNEDFYVNGIELWMNIKGIFPVKYLANVYVDACESADHDSRVFSFIEVFYTQFALSNNGMVFGKNGASSGLIPTPGNPKWIPAT